MRASGLTVVAVAVLALTTACQVSECTAMGADSGVGFEDIDNAFPNYQTRYEVRACAGDECVDWVGDRRDATRLWVPLDDLTGPTTVTATLTLTSLVDPAEVVFDASTSVDLVRFQPNGPGCAPTVYQGRVQVTAAGDLEVPVLASEQDPA